jgi:APA family basic amino acid/polyamine antiporter
LANNNLKRNLSLLHVTMLGVGGAVSAGVFVTIGHASSLAGASLIFVMITCGIINLFTMLSYAELGAAIPKAGGEYTFSKAAFGGFLSFSTGWFEWISNIFYSTFSALGFAYIISYAIPALNIPLTAIIIIAIFSLINLKGVSEMGLTQTILVLSLLTILAVFIIGGLMATPNLDQPVAEPPPFINLLRATAFVFVVYLGGEAIAGAQEEIKEPAKTLPRAIILSSFILIFIYAAITQVIFRFASADILSSQASPLAYVAAQFSGPIGVGIITIAGAIAALTSVNTSTMAHSRVAYALARDGYFPRQFTNLHKRFATPFLTILVGAIITSAFAATGQVTFLTYATDFGFIIGFIFVNLSLIRLRKTKPKLPRPFKVPLYPLTPILGIATSLLLIVFLEPLTLLVGLTLFVFGLVVYYLCMVGSETIHLAIGGMNACIALFTALFASLILTNTLPIELSPEISNLVSGVSIIVSLVCTIYVIIMIKNGRNNK